MAKSIKQFRRDMEDAIDEIEDGMKDAAKLGVDTYKTEARHTLAVDDKVASAELFNGIKGHSFSVQKFGNKRVVRAKYLSDAPHSGYVEHGVGDKGDGKFPKNPDVTWDVIFEWGNVKPTFFWFQNPIGASQRIAANIRGEGEGRGGIAPSPFFKPSVEQGFSVTEAVLRFRLEDAFTL